MARSAKPLARIRIGRSFKAVRSDTNFLAQEVGDTLMKELEKQIRTRFIKMQGKVLATRIARVIRKEIGTIPITVANYAIGTFQSSYDTVSPDGSGDFAETEVIFDKVYEQDEVLYWRNLSRQTIQRKRDKGGYMPRFFIETGALQKDIRQNAGRGLQALNQGFNQSRSAQSVTVDGVSVKMEKWPEHTARTPRFKIGELSVDLFPRLRTSSILENYTGFPAMTIEKRLGLSKESIEKLRGPTKNGFNVVHRALFQPVMRHYIQARIPAVIQRAVRKAQTTIKDTSTLG